MTTEKEPQRIYWPYFEPMAPTLLETLKETLSNPYTGSLLIAGVVVVIGVILRTFGVI